MKIKKRTVRRLRAAASKLFPEDDLYYQFIGQHYGVESTLELTEKQAIEALQTIDQELKVQKVKTHGKRRKGFLTSNQKEYIEGMFAELGWDPGPRQWGFIKKQIGKQSSVDMLTNRDASKVITGLERMMADGYGKEAK